MGSESNGLVNRFKWTDSVLWIRPPNATCERL